MMPPTQHVLRRRLSARSAIEVDPLPSADQAEAIDRNSPPRKHIGVLRIHTGPDRGSGTVGGTSSDLAGEHASLWRSPGTGGEGPAPCRLQHHRDLHFRSRRPHHGGQRGLSQHRGVWPRRPRVGPTALDRANTSRMGRSRRAGLGGVGFYRDLQALREGVFSKRRQPCAGASGVRDVRRNPASGRRLRSST